MVHAPILTSEKDRSAFPNSNPARRTFLSKRSSFFQELIMLRRPKKTKGAGRKRDLRRKTDLCDCRIDIALPPAAVRKLHALDGTFNTLSRVFEQTSSWQGCLHCLEEAASAGLGTLVQFMPLQAHSACNIYNCAACRTAAERVLTSACALEPQWNGRMPRDSRARAAREAHSNEACIRGVQLKV